MDRQNEEKGKRRRKKGMMERILLFKVLTNGDSRMDIQGLSYFLDALEQRKGEI